MKTIKNLKKEKESLENEIKHQRFLLNMTKTDCCDLCMSDGIHYRNGITCSADLNKPECQPYIRIEMGYRTIGLCKRHMKELADALQEELNNS